jgi:hypothetical protein
MVGGDLKLVCTKGTWPKSCNICFIFSFHYRHRFFVVIHLIFLGLLFWMSLEHHGFKPSNHVFMGNLYGVSIGTISCYNFGTTQWCSRSKSEKGWVWSKWGLFPLVMKGLVIVWRRLKQCANVQRHPKKCHYAYTYNGVPRFPYTMKWFQSCLPLVSCCFGNGVVCMEQPFQLFLWWYYNLRSFVCCNI